MTYSIRFSLADDSIVRNLKGEPIYLYQIAHKIDYPIWGILLVSDSYGSLAVKQLCKGELKIKKIIVHDTSHHITLSRKIRSNGWDTEFCMGENDSLVSLIWSESAYTHLREFNIQASWNPEGGFAFRNGTKEFLLDVYGINSVGIYTVYFECDLSSLLNEYSSRKWLYPCIPYVQSLEGQDPKTYSVHYFNGTRGQRQPQFTIPTTFDIEEPEETEGVGLQYSLDPTIPYAGTSEHESGETTPRISSLIPTKVEAKISKCKSKRSRRTQRPRRTRKTRKPRSLKDSTG